MKKRTLGTEVEIEPFRALLELYEILDLFVPDRNGQFRSVVMVRALKTFLVAFDQQRLNPTLPISWNSDSARKGPISTSGWKWRQIHFHGFLIWATNWIENPLIAQEYSDPNELISENENKPPINCWHLKAQPKALTEQFIWKNDYNSKWH